MAVADWTHKPRLYIVSGLIIALFAVLLIRLAQVQLQHGERHLETVREQSVRRIRLNPARGRIFGRNGRTPVARNRPRTDLVFHLSEMRQPGPRSATVNHILKEAQRAGRYIDRTLSLTPAEIKRHLKVRPTLPLTIFKGLDRVELARLGELFPPIKGGELLCRLERVYKYPEAFSHVLGFTGHRRALPAEAKNRYAYVRPQLTGRWGLEASRNNVLSGRGGTKLVLVNALGFVQKELRSSVPPESGNDLILTLDVRAQRIAHALLQDVQGALVALDVNTGAVRAMVSSPSFNPNNLTQKKYTQLINDRTTRPMLNRDIYAGYLPGSIIKPLVALAALKKDVITPGTTYNCPGFYRMGDTRIHCWNRMGHGELNLIEAIEQSCNVYFIKAGLKTGLDNIRPILQAAGIGRKPDLPLPVTSSGILPGRDWARENWGRSWLAIDTAYLSIGHGAISMSPLQVARYCAALANGGTLYEPFLIKAVRSPEGTIIKRTPPTPVDTLPVSQQNLSTVKQGMYNVVHGDNATAASADNDVISVSGKTGTAEVTWTENTYNLAWFMCFGPVKSPRYAVAVVVERGESGGKTAAPIARKFFTNWLSD